MWMILTIISLLQVVTVHSLDNGLARTPPMGWLSWERFRCNIDCKNDPDNCISENLYMKMADLMVSEGFKDAGYQFVNIDDCWMARERDSKGRLQADPDRFPHGIKALADYIHSKGLKLGIYEDFGTETCGGYPGSEFYMQSDANSFAEWDVDMLKFDGCNSDPKDMDTGYPVMSQFLNLTGHKMVFSCEWPLYQVVTKQKPNYAAIRTACNLWRNYRDVQDGWDSIVSIIDFYGKDEGNFSGFAGPGGWNDPDMLVVGDFGLSYNQQKTQMALWSLWSAPLFMSTDLRTIDSASKALLQHPGLIAINQDPLGAQAVRLYQISSLGVWLKPLAKTGSYAIGIVNRDNQGMPNTVKLQLNQLGLPGPSYNISDVFENKPLGVYTSTDMFIMSIEPTSIFIGLAVPSS
ncbi:alpha-galactosidase A isoform X2 [Patella vulgata]|uniref:alpha-galactosidase A isoform X2 n=1 Tax=Patella vulgata TaxID=6465 RepID=UPI0021807263|nr:alpha-galactosidase A isoform X2 [Patella vulgata]